MTAKENSEIKERNLDEEIEESFPASDPPAHTQPKKEMKKLSEKEKEGFCSREEMAEAEENDED